MSFNRTPEVLNNKTINSPTINGTVAMSSGGIISFDGGDVTLTHSSGLLTLSDTLSITNGELILGGATAVEVGGVTPDFQKLGTDAAGGAMHFHRATADGSAARIYFSKSRGTSIGSATIVQDGDNIAELRVYAADGVDFANFIGQIFFEVDGTPAENDVPGRFKIATSAGSGANPSTRLTVGADGDVGIGTTNPGGQLEVEQTDSAGAQPVLVLDQDDIDDTFINFIGTSAADGTRSISSDTTEDSSKFGAIRIEINGTTKWIRVYDDES